MGDESLLKSAVAVLQQATKLDQDKNANDAYVKYIEGVEILMRYWKTLPKTDPSRTNINQRLIGYVERAEQLKAAVTFQVEKFEQRQILADSTGHSYETVFGRCLDAKLTAVNIQDAYMGAHHQAVNFVRFCELVVDKAPNVKLFTLITGNDSRAQEQAFKELQDDLAGRNIKLKVEYKQELHDREIRFDNGWVVKIGRGLDYFKPPPGRFRLGSGNQNFRTCRETTVDIFRVRR